MRQWLVQHVPWWAVMVLWFVPMLLIGALLLLVVVGSIVGAVMAAADGELLHALFRSLRGGLALLFSAWWFDEVEHWREVTPAALRPRTNLSWTGASPVQDEVD